MFVVAGGLIWLWLARQQRVITAELIEEAESGLVSRRDIKLTPRYWRRQKRRLGLIRSSQLQRARAEEVLHTELARLAFCKRRGRDGPRSKGSGETKGVTHLRAEVRRAKAEVRFARLVESE